jgi:helicase MOV-10
MSFDVYAEAFVPKWLKDINEAPPQLVFATAATDFEIPFEEYTRTFAGRSMLEDHSLSLDSSLEIVAPSIGKSAHVLPQPSSYQRLFHKALADEFRSLQASQKRFNLSKVVMNSITVDPSGTSVTAHLSVPGLRENSPFIRLGDTVTLRPLCIDAVGFPVPFQQFPGQAAFYFPVAGWNGSEFQSIVESVNRHYEVLALKIDNPATFEPYCRGPVNVSFPIRANWATSQYVAVQNIHCLMNAKNAQQSWTRQMLFPEPSDGYEQRILNSAEFKIKKFNSLLNFEQLKAVNAVFENNYGNIPFLISGPPGTGKTMTTVEAALQLVLNKKCKHIIVCAPSDPAADTLAQRLKQYLHDPSDLFRMNAPSRTFAEVPEGLMQYCYVENRCFGLPLFKQMMKFKVIVTTCRDADMLIRSRLTNRDLHELEQTLLSTLHPEDEPNSRPLHWDALFIDEAAQAIEPEALIPITVIAPPAKYPGPHLPQVIMAGDHKQLGPRTASTVGIIKASLFERLLERPTYSQHPLARSRKSRNQGLTQAMLPIKRPPFCDLIRNYRSHPAILAIPNSLFYHDTLLAEASDTDSLLSWPGWKAPGWPAQFTCNHGTDELEQDGGGWYNLTEAHKALFHAQSILQSGLIDQQDICVMSPFQAQVRHLRILFRNAGLGNVNIGPMEAFQGLESRFVILCTTRARKRFVDEDVKRGMGIIHEEKRFNVALTRAKQGLVVIGNPELLAIDSAWFSFLEFCRRNGAWEVDDVGVSGVGAEGVEWGSVPLLELLTGELPVLEKMLLNDGVEEGEEKQLGSVMYRDDEMWAHGLHDALPSEEDEEEEANEGAEIEEGYQGHEEDEEFVEEAEVEGIAIDEQREQKVVGKKKPDTKKTAAATHTCTRADVKKLAGTGVTKPGFTWAKVAATCPPTRAK